MAAPRVQCFRRSMRSYRSQVEKCQIFSHCNTTSSVSASTSARSPQANPTVCPFAPFRNRRQDQFSARHQKRAEVLGELGRGLVVFGEPRLKFASVGEGQGPSHTPPLIQCILAAPHTLQPYHHTHALTLASPVSPMPHPLPTHTTLHQVRSNV